MGMVKVNNLPEECAVVKGFFVLVRTLGVNKLVLQSTAGGVMGKVPATCQKPIFLGYHGRFWHRLRTLCVKGHILSHRAGSSIGKTSTMSLFFAIIAFCLSLVPADAVLPLVLLGITLLRILAMVVLNCLGSSQMGCTLQMHKVYFYPCLMRPIKEMEEQQYLEDFKDNNDDNEAQLERENGFQNTGGELSPKEQGGCHCEVLFSFPLFLPASWGRGRLCTTTWL